MLSSRSRSDRGEEAVGRSWWGGRGGRVDNRAAGGLVWTQHTHLNSSYTKLVDGVIVVRLLLTERPRRRRWYLTRDAIGTISQPEPRTRPLGHTPQTTLPGATLRTTLTESWSSLRCCRTTPGHTSHPDTARSNHTSPRFAPHPTPTPSDRRHSRGPVDATARTGGVRPTRATTLADPGASRWQGRSPGVPARDRGGEGEGWRLPDLFSSVCLFMRCPGATQHG